MAMEESVIVAMSDVIMETREAWLRRHGCGYGGECDCGDE